jgi:hypothetical protein
LEIQIPSIRWLDTLTKAAEKHIADWGRWFFFQKCFRVQGGALFGKTF